MAVDFLKIGRSSWMVFWSSELIFSPPLISVGLVSLVWIAKLASCNDSVMTLRTNLSQFNFSVSKSRLLSFLATKTLLSRSTCSWISLLILSDHCPSKSSEIKLSIKVSQYCSRANISLSFSDNLPSLNPARTPGFKENIKASLIVILVASSQISFKSSKSGESISSAWFVPSAISLAPFFSYCKFWSFMKANAISLCVESFKSCMKSPDLLTMSFSWKAWSTDSSNDSSDK